MIYIDNAATSWPKPPGVLEALDRFARTLAGNPGRSGHRLAAAAEEVVQDTRKRLASLIGAESPDRIAFTLNGTDALNIALKGTLRKGDHVITSVLEHNSVRRPLSRLEQQGLIEVSRAPADGTHVISPEDIRRLLRKNTRLIALTHCPNVLGVVQPVEEYSKIAREAGALLLLDAAQTAGVVPIDVRRTGIDLLAFPGHKGLFGTMGTGALYVREGVDVGFFREGGVGYAPEVELHPERMPYRLEAGTPNAHGIAALGAGLRFLEQQGVEKILRHERTLAMDFIRRLEEYPDRFTVYSGRDPDRQIGPVSLNVKGVPAGRVASILDRKHGIACRPGLHCAPGTHRHLGTLPEGTVRFSFGFFNTPEHLDAAVRALLDVSA